MSRGKLAVASTNEVSLTGMRVRRTYPADATVVLTALLDSLGAVVLGTANILMPYVAGTTGRFTQYQGVIPHTVTIIKGAAYVARITATDANGNVHQFDLDCDGVKG